MGSLEQKKQGGAFSSSSYPFLHMRALKKGLPRRKRKQNILVPEKEHSAQLDDR
jgi:hypothetical protein